MDMLQVLRKNPWERSHFDWMENKETATKVFNLLRDIVERRMLEHQAAVSSREAEHVHGREQVEI
jgi:hypothetical protein